MLVTLISAWVTTLPDGSVSVPLIAPVPPVCAIAVSASSVETAAPRATLFLLVFMIPPHLVVSSVNFSVVFVVKRQPAIARRHFLLLLFQKRQRAARPDMSAGHHQCVNRRH